MLGGMTAAALPTPESGHGRPPFADASPAQVRVALTPEDAAEFDKQWHAAATAGCWPGLRSAVGRVSVSRGACLSIR